MSFSQVNMFNEMLKQQMSLHEEMNRKLAEQELHQQKLREEQHQLEQQQKLREDQHQLEQQKKQRSVHNQQSNGYDQQGIQQQSRDDQLNEQRSQHGVGDQQGLQPHGVGNDHQGLQPHGVFNDQRGQLHGLQQQRGGGDHQQVLQQRGNYHQGLLLVGDHRLQHHMGDHQGLDHHRGDHLSVQEPTFNQSDIQQQKLYAAVNLERQMEADTLSNAQVLHASHSGRAAPGHQPGQQLSGRMVPASSRDTETVTLKVCVNCNF